MARVSLALLLAWYFFSSRVIQRTPICCFFPSRLRGARQPTISIFLLLPHAALSLLLLPHGNLLVALLERQMACWPFLPRDMAMDLLLPHAA